MNENKLKLNRFLQKQPQQNEETKSSIHNSLYSAPKRNSTGNSQKGRIPGNEEDDGAPNILTGTVITSCFIQTSALPSRVEMEGNNITFYDDTFEEGGVVSGDTARLVFTHDLNSNEGFILEKRASVNNTYDNVLSWYATPAKNNRYNLMFIGRDGRSSLTESRNLNYFELTTDASSTIGVNSFNSQIIHQISLDKAQLAGELSMFWIGAISAGNTGVGVNVFGSGDQSASDLGYGAIGYKDQATGTLLATVEVNKLGVQITGLPTSSAGLPSGYLWNDAGTLKIVP